MAAPSYGGPSPAYSTVTASVRRSKEAATVGRSRLGLAPSKCLVIILCDTLGKSIQLTIEIKLTYFSLFSVTMSYCVSVTASKIMHMLTVLRSTTLLARAIA